MGGFWIDLHDRYLDNVSVSFMIWQVGGLRVDGEEASLSLPLLLLRLLIDLELGIFPRILDLLVHHPDLWPECHVDASMCSPDMVTHLFGRILADGAEWAVS